MAHLVNYDYESMDNAYEDMKKTSDTMRQSCEDLTSDALRLLQSSAGAYAAATRPRRRNATITSKSSTSR